MKTSRHFLTISIPVLAFVYPLPSLAQLEEVIVTATKIETSIQDTPIAVTAFTQDQLDSQLINDTMNLQFSVPNMTMTKTNFTASDIRIRGIGSGAIGSGGGNAGRGGSGSCPVACSTRLARGSNQWLRGMLLSRDGPTLTRV